MVLMSPWPLSRGTATATATAAAMRRARDDAPAGGAWRPGHGCGSSPGCGRLPPHRRPGRARRCAARSSSSVCSLTGPSPREAGQARPGLGAHGSSPNPPTRPWRRRSRPRVGRGSSAAPAPRARRSGRRRRAATTRSCSAAATAGRLRRAGGGSDGAPGVVTVARPSATELRPGAVQDAAAEVGGRPIELAQSTPAEVQLHEGVLDHLFGESDVAQHQRRQAHERCVVLAVQQFQRLGVAAGPATNAGGEGVDLYDRGLEVGRRSVPPAASQEATPSDPARRDAHHRHHPLQTLVRHRSVDTEVAQHRRPRRLRGRLSVV